MEKKNIADNTADISKVILKRILVAHAGGSQRATYCYGIVQFASFLLYIFVLSVCKILIFSSLIYSFDDR
jgi:hypothetical protein